MALRDVIGEEEKATGGAPRVEKYGITVADKLPITIPVAVPQETHDESLIKETAADPLAEEVRLIRAMLRDPDRPLAFPRRRHKQHNPKSQRPQPVTHGMLGLGIMHRRPTRGM